MLKQLNLNFDYASIYAETRLRITNLEKDIMALIRKEPGITVTKIYKYFPNKYTTKAALVRLSKLGMIKIDGFSLYVSEANRL